MTVSSDNVPRFVLSPDNGSWVGSLILALVFFSHGALYYAFPEQHYLLGGNGGWLQGIKYFVFLLFFLTWIAVGRFAFANVLAFVLFQILGLLSFIYSGDQSKALIYFSFLIPSFVLLFPYAAVEKNSKYLNRLVFVLSLALIFLNSFGLIFEYFSGALVGAYSASGFRATGIFVNPNNSAIMSVIMLAFVFGLTGNVLIKMLSAGVVLFSLVLLGSKTGYVSFFVVFLVYYPFLAFVFILLAIFFLVYNVWGFSPPDVRSPFDLASANIRLDDWLNFFEIFGSAPFGNLFLGMDGLYLVDNSYLDILANFGLLMLFFFVLIQAFVLVRAFRVSKLIFVFSVVVFVSMLTTNLHRVWPVSYLLWAVVGWSLYASFSKFPRIKQERGGYVCK